ncbi:MAG TPA: regulatory iron-sulfur-containing complex subunit RicT, partial [Chitinivibrionales bacterium]|nr:regulatory iron-sulfur-containing complex subunit RicT [Chitinivibrionales bacterium]
MSKNSKLVEVVFKGERRAIYRNRNELDINEGDAVVVEAERGEDLGRISLVGALVKLKRGQGDAKGIIRKALEKDWNQHNANLAKENDAYKVCREKIRHYNLDMKLVDVEMQFDGSKITFFFTAAQRVDFRELVKDLASVYRTRIELRQIGVRDEAKRVSGFGICGRKQCCSAFLTEFEQITTQMAKDQEISLNPAKISGNCGRLLCCLRYEEELYRTAFKDFPPIEGKLKITGKDGKERDGLLTFINVFKNLGQVRFTDGTSEWLTPEELSKGRVENKEPANGAQND